MITMFSMIVLKSFIFSKYVFLMKLLIIIKSRSLEEIL